MATEADKQSWLARVLGVIVPAGASQPGDRFEPIYHDLLATIPADLKRLATQDAARAAKIGTVVRAAVAAAAKGNFDVAARALESAAEAIGRAAGDTAAAQAASAIPQGKVASTVKLLEQAQSRWDGGFAAAQAGGRGFHADLAAAFPAEGKGFEQILDSYWQELATAIESAQRQDPAVGLPGVIAKAQTLRAEMMADPLFAHLDGHGVAVRPAFLAALDDLDKMLVAA